MHELAGARGARAARVEDESVVTEGRGAARAYVLLVAYDRLLEGLDRICQYHFELLNLGYGAYLVFYELCRRRSRTSRTRRSRRWSPVSTSSSCARTTSSSASPGWRSSSGSPTHVQGAGGEEDAAGRSRRQRSPERGGWPTSRRRRIPGSTSPTGTGLYHHHRSWIDDPTLPIATIGAYIGRLEAGEDISRPSAAIVAERERITDEHRACSPRSSAPGLRREPRARAHCLPLRREPQLLHRPLVPDDLLEQGARVRRAPRPARLPGRRAEDIFFLRHDEVRSALEELRLFWSSGGAGPPSGRSHWPPIVERRKAIYDGDARWSPPPALGLVARRDHRADHRHALGHHHRAHPGMARPPTDAAPTHVDRDVAGRRGSSKDRSRDPRRGPTAASSRRARSSSQPSPPRAGHPSSARSRRRSWTSAASCAMRPSSPASTACRQSSAPASGRSGSGPETGSASTPTPAS